MCLIILSMLAQWACWTIMPAAVFYLAVLPKRKPPWQALCQLAGWPEVKGAQERQWPSTLKPDSILAHCRDGGPLEHELKTPMPLAEVNDLRSGRAYRFRVQAFNEVCRLSLVV